VLLVRQLAPFDGIAAGEDRFAMPDPVAQTQRRIERAEETKAAIARVQADPSPDNIAALHRLHAQHLREDGDPEGASRAEERAKHAEPRTRRP
jgi:hypothetical protein